MALIKVGMADLKAVKHPDNLTTLGLGSCIGVTLYDTSSKISGMAHFMLPDSTQIKNNENKAKFGDTAIDELLKQMLSLGASKTRLVAKIAGGAQMFSFGEKNDLMRIGERNAIAAKEKLKALGIRLIAEDTGNNYGRTIEFMSENGDLHVKTIGKELKVI